MGNIWWLVILLENIVILILKSINDIFKFYRIIMLKS